MRIFCIQIYLNYSSKDVWKGSFDVRHVNVWHWFDWWYREVRVLRTWQFSTIDLFTLRNFLQLFWICVHLLCSTKWIIAKLIRSKTFSIISFESQLYVCFKQIKNSCQKSTSKRSRIESLVAQMLKDNDARFFLFLKFFFVLDFFFQQPLSFLVCQYVCSTKTYILTENVF